MIRSRKKFSLVELLTVIGIMSILTSMLMPALNAARLKAKTISCLSNAGQISKATTSYAGDYDGLLPCATMGVSTGGQVMYDQTSGSYFPMGVMAREKYANPTIFGCAGAGDEVIAPVQEIVDRLELRTSSDLRERWEMRTDASNVSAYVDSAYRWRTASDVRLDHGPNNLLYDFQISAPIIAAPLHNYAFGSLAYRDGHARTIRAENVTLRIGYSTADVESYIDEYYAE